MKKAATKPAVFACAAFALAALGPGAARAVPVGPGGNIYKWPDLTTGMWAPDVSARFAGKATPLPFTPAAKAARDAAAKKLGGSASCDPVGPVGIINAGFPLKFYYSPGEIIVMSDMDALWVRHVYMDGRKHGDPNPSYHGNSIGSWDGKSLVIDTVGLNDKVDIAPLTKATDKSHLTERYALTGPNTMTLTLTIDDPNVMTGPYTVTQSYFRHADWHIEDTFCGEGNRDQPDASGNEHLDLTPPPEPPHNGGAQ